MNTTSPACSVRFRAVRRGLYVSVALAIGTVAVPSFAQSTGSAQANDLQGENQALRTENELLRQRLAALGGGQVLADASLPTQLAVANSRERQAFLAADANDDGGERGPAGGSGPDIVVTADGQKGPAADLNALKDVPKSIAVITPAELKIFDQVSLPDALSRLGNVRWNDGNSRTGSFSLRGLTASAGSDTIDPSVGLVIDGVPYASLSLGDTINLLDIEQINVTKGPQGTTGARQTSVGQINVINRHPSFTPDGSASLTVGQNSALRAEFEGGGPIIEDLLAFRITAMRDQRNGNWWNSFVGVKGLQSFPNVDRTYGRAQLLFTPTKDLSVRLQYDLAPNGNEYINGLSFGKPTPLNYANGALVDQSTTAVTKLGRRWFTQQSAYNAATDYYSFNPNLDAVRAITTGGKGALSDVEWNFGKHTFSWIASWRSSYFLAGNDDGTPFDITKDGGFITTYEQFTSEAKLQGELGDGLLDYTTGLFFLKSDSDSLSRTRYGSDAGAYNTNATQYNTLDANAAGRLLMGNALNRLYVGNQSYLHYLSKAAYAQLDWHVSNRLTLTTGFRFTREKRKVTQGITPLDQGYGVALNPVSVGNVQLGGFNSTASGALAAGNSATQIALADSVAAQYFNVAAYSSLTAPQLAQVAAAKALRQTQLGTLYNLTVATPWEGNLYTGQLSLRNEFSKELTAYATLQYGEKPGISLFNGLLPDNSGPRPLTVAKERTLTYELGLRANVLDGDLVLNADIFRSDIWNFQQSVYFFDPLITALRNDGTLYYTSGTGNVPRVRSQGLEAQLSYSGIKYATFRVSGAYTDAKYVDYQFAGQPSENANLAVKYRDISGHTLPNAPKVQFNATATYRRPVLGDKLIHASAGYTYTSKQNGDSALSAYGVQHAYGIADLSLGFGREDGLFDINLIVRNLFDEKRQDAGWSSITIYQKPRWIGVSLSSKFL